jgi:hypothetical protein
MTRRGGDAETRRARNRIGIPVSPCPRVPVSVLSPNCRIRPAPLIPTLTLQVERAASRLGAKSKLHLQKAHLLII